jgi:L-lactate dehydrogenase complex protein LldG
MTSREAFLQRVRQAVTEGNRAGTALPLPERGSVGYQGAAPDPVQRFCTELAAAGGLAHVVADPDSAVAQILHIVETTRSRKVLLSKDRLVENLGLASILSQRGLEILQVDQVTSASWRDLFFQADLGISGVAHLIAETGTVVMASTPDQPRSVSLLPPFHIALAQRSQLLPDLFDLFDLFSPLATPNKVPLPSCLSLITGPSKTGDIELRLVTGVHGPGELHVILANW